MDRRVLPAHYAAASERIKYALATSALLSADLRDALQLYPPLLPPPPPPSTTLTRTTRARRVPLKATVEWPQGWQHAGSLVDTALNAWSALANSLTLTPAPPQATTPASASSSPVETLTRPARDRTAQEAAIAAVNRFVAAAQHLDLQIAAALSAIKQLECIAHGLGLSDPLPPISRIEARSYSHHLLVVSVPCATTTPVSTPTTAAAAIRRRPPPRPLRALALRRALARALDETLAVLERATADLNALLPRDSPLLNLVPTKPPPSHAHSPLLPLDPSDSNSDSDSEERESTEGNDTGAKGGGGGDDMNGNRRRRRKTRQSGGGASIAELLRHDERARRERDELDKFNNISETSCSYAGEEGEEEEDLSAADAASDQRTSSSFSGHDPTPPPPPPPPTTTVADPYHPTEHTFGGIERRRHASLNSPAAAVRLRDSLSSASPLRRSHRQRHSLSPRRRWDGPSSLEEEIIAAAARDDAGQGEGEGLVDPSTAAETTRRMMMMMTPQRGAPRLSTTSSVATPPPPPPMATTDSWKRSRSRRPVSLGGVSATPTNLRRALSVHSSTPGGGDGGRSTRGAEEEEEGSNADSGDAAAAESSKSPSPSSSSSSKSSTSGSPPPGPPLSATSSPTPDPARLPAALAATEPNSDAVSPADVVPFLLVSLQDTFDDLHALRRGVIWRLLEALSGAESDRNWNALAGVVGGGLAERMEEIAKEVEKAQEREFGNGGGATADVGVDGGSSAAAFGSTKDGRVLEIERRKEKEKRRRSGAYGRELLDDNADEPDVVDVDADVDVEENVLSDPGRGEPAMSSRRDALARLTGVTPSSSPMPGPSSSSLLDNRTKPNRRAPASYADFAPPSSSSFSSTAAASSSSGSANPDLVAHARAMALALRAVEAKLRLVVDEVAHSSPSGSLHPVHENVDDDDDGQRRRLSAVVEMYRGIGIELKRLEEQWRIGGEVLEKAAGLVQSVERANPASAEDAEAEPSVAVRDIDGPTGQQEDEARNQLGAEDAVLQTEPCEGTGEEDDPIASRQALVDAALSASLLIPPSAAPAEEKVFEAVAGPVRSTSSDGSNKFSREERIRRMKEAREALARGRESLESSPVKSRTDSASDAGSPLGSRSGAGGSSSLAQQQKMVGELQEVLREYNRERGREVGGPDTAAASTPLTPTKSTTALPSPLALPQPPIPFPVASPPVAASPPPRPTFALPPPPPPPAHQQAVTFATTSPQKALPQTPPRNAISPVSGLRGRPTPPPVQSPLGQKGTPSSSGKRYSVQSV